MVGSNPRSSLWRRAAAIGLALFVAACDGGPKDPSTLGVGSGGLFGSDIIRGVSCPQTAVLDEPSDLTRFSDTSASGISGILFRASLEMIESFCQIGDEDVDVTVTTEIKVARGPANTKGEANLVYFVAVLDDKKNVVFRTRFPLIVKFSKRQSRVAFSENFALRIDVRQDLEPADYLIYLGFEMTPSELDFSRDRRQR
ncbi:MAG: hypothetical protein QF654_05235 [Alphaproteobacteria bacterium]|jgi:hypothetical protein|nr:hypothetical protein [Alphaproteobacteria bacterium]